MTESEPATPPGCTLIGWAGCDITGIDYYQQEPVQTGSQQYLIGKHGFSFMKSLLDIPPMHARRLYVGPVIDLTPQPAVEWVTVGVNSVAVCEGYSLLVITRLGDWFIDVLSASGSRVTCSRDTKSLPAAQAWAVSKARELARTAKGGE
jgi:hypothetical protein